VGNNYQNIFRLEKGEITPTIFLYHKLAEVFEMDFTDLKKEFGFKSKK
jgi:DNA-binding XRE family transcriptional regulator